MRAVLSRRISPNREYGPYRVGPYRSFAVPCVTRAVPDGAEPYALLPLPPFHPEFRSTRTVRMTSKLLPPPASFHQVSLQYLRNPVRLGVWCAPLGPVQDLPSYAGCVLQLWQYDSRRRPAMHAHLPMPALRHHFSSIQSMLTSTPTPWASSAVSPGQLS
jgi:hypothetical protein